MTLKEISNRIEKERNNLLSLNYQFYIDNLCFILSYNMYKEFYFIIAVYKNPNNSFVDFKFKLNFEESVYNQIEALKNSSIIKEDFKNNLSYYLDCKDFHEKINYTEYSKESESKYLIEIDYLYKKDIKLRISSIKYRDIFSHLLNGGYNNNACVYLSSSIKKDFNSIEAIILKLKSKIDYLPYIEEHTDNREGLVHYNENNQLIYKINEHIYTLTEKHLNNSLDLISKLYKLN